MDNNYIERTTEPEDEEKMYETLFDGEKDENENDEDTLILKLKKEVTFEGKTYSEINLEGLESLTGADLAKIQRRIKKQYSDDLFVEMSMEYAFAIAARATSLPAEFFLALPAKDARAVQTKVRSFLLN